MNTEVWVTGVLCLWVLEPLGYNSAFFRKLTMLRVLRLIRIFQRLRIYPNFKLPWRRRRDGIFTQVSLMKRL